MMWDSALLSGCVVPDERKIKTSVLTLLQGEVRQRNSLAHYVVICLTTGFLHAALYNQLTLLLQHGLLHRAALGGLNETRQHAYLLVFLMCRLGLVFACVPCWRKVFWIQLRVKRKSRNVNTIKGETAEGSLKDAGFVAAETSEHLVTDAVMKQTDCSHMNPADEDCVHMNYSIRPVTCSLDYTHILQKRF